MWYNLEECEKEKREEGGEQEEEERLERRHTTDGMKPNASNL